MDGRGLSCIAENTLDVIVLDLIMLGMDGIEVLRQIRSVDLHQRVIVVTADSRPKTEWEVRALGVSEFLVKGLWCIRLGTRSSAFSRPPPQ